MNNRPSALFKRILPFLAALIFSCLGISFIVHSIAPSVAPTVIEIPARHVHTVVLDAGHGGEDGGASSADGALEKDLNLSLTLLLRDLLLANGINVILTRETDTLLYDKNADYEGRKKALDMAERKKIAEEATGCVFVSIHMNSYPTPTCRGLQVWYSKNDPRSLALAESVRSVNHALLQPQNDRTVSAAGSGIYLLHTLDLPAILIECGFLSTPDEAALLATESYQKKLAFSIFCGIMAYTDENP